MIKLHLGCGSKDFGKEWVHIDGSHYPHIKYHNITKLNGQFRRASFEDDSVDLIYTSHTLEYFDRDKVIDVLREWRRVLRPDGVLRLAVPDFEACAKLYVNNDEPLSSFVGMFYGKWKMNGKPNGRYGKKTIYHKTIYDFPSLKKVLEDNGFNNVKKWNWRDVEHGDIDDYSQAYLPHMDKENGTLVSLNVECNK